MLRTLKKYPVVSFYILAFTLAWCIKIPVVLSNTDNIAFRLLPSFFPAIAALIMAAVMAGKTGIGDLLGQGGRLKISPVWYSIALIGPVCLNLLAIVLAIPFGEVFPRFAFPGIRVLPAIVIAIFFALGEEFGWRGFALPYLQGRFNALVASLIVGLLWWAWHLPEALAAGGIGLSSQQVTSLEIRDLVMNIAASILMTWIYNKTGRSVLLVALFHVGIGLLGQFLVTSNTSNVSLVAILFNGLLCITATIVVVGNRTTYLTRERSEEFEISIPLAVRSDTSRI